MMSIVDNLICFDPGQRGIYKIYPDYEMRNPNFTKKAANIVLKNLDNVLIIVGFPLNGKGISGETDGPPGAVFLHKTIRDLGGNSKILTIASYEDALKDMVDEVITINDLESTPSLTISIETPGRNEFGSFDMKGNSVDSREISKINKVFSELNCPKISIGDGGNEIGMGNIQDLIIENIEKGKKIRSEVETDQLVIGGTSNWGAYGILSQISVQVNDIFVPSPKEEKSLLKKCLNNGLVDGVTKEPSISVDGLPFSVLKSFLKLLRGITQMRI